MLLLEKLTPDTAVIDNDGRQMRFPADMLRGCAEGDVLIKKGDIFITDTAATKKRREDILRLQDSLWSDDQSSPAE